MKRIEKLFLWHSPILILSGALLIFHKEYDSNFIILLAVMILILGGMFFGIGVRNG